ncbi:MAG: helix-turn-helix domain-containing protein [Oligoflexia bacterium]|nr:helix-turn-helix domain-containing protein [Oligoflexia bacterium]
MLSPIQFNQNDEKNSIKSDMLFNNLPEILKASTAAKILDVSIKTIYNWRYRQKTRKIPNNLFLKVNRALYLRTAVLRQWVASQNSSLEFSEDKENTNVC